MRLAAGVASIVSSSVALLGAAMFTAHAAQTPAVPITISGQVFAAETGEPLVNARVMLTGPNDFRAVALTRIGDGGFTFASVPAGAYRLSAAKPGYVRGEFGAPSFGLAGALRMDGRPIGDIQIRLVRGAAIGGRVLDSRGDPQAGQTIVAAWGGDDEGRGATAIAATRTDDLGQYRLGGLPAGTIRVLVGGLPLPWVSAGRPTARLAEPRLVMLDVGEERFGADFVLQRPFPSVDAVARRSTTTGAAIRGRIVSDDGKPLYRAQVMLLLDDETPVSRVFTGDFNLLKGPTPLKSTFTDESGQYELGGLSPGRYRVGARQSGYVPMGFDQPRSSALGGAIAIDADSRNGIDIALPRLGVVAGRITDENGDPIEGAIVTIVGVRFEDGDRVLVPAATSAPSDDRGQYRVFGIEPGRYLVRAGPGDRAGLLRFGIPTGDEIPGYAPSFFPGTFTAPQAARVDVAPSGSLTGVDFPLVRTAMVTVAGRVFTSDNQPFQGPLKITPRSQRELTAAYSAGAIIYPDGRFEFRDVVPGEYVISSSRGRRSSTEGEFGAVAVTVGAENVTGVILTTSIGSTLGGHLTFDGTPAPRAREVVISTMPTDPDLAPGRSELASANPDADGTFALGGITGTRRLRIVRLPAGWAVKSITWNGVDVTDAPLRFGTAAQSTDTLEVLLTNRVTQISGEVTDPSGRRVSNAAVVAFATDSERWYRGSRFVRYAALTGGTFTIQGLPAGEYFLAAVARTRDLDDGGWQDRTILDKLSAGAARVLLGDEQRLAQNLRISSR
jgi:carboxypeptidase family protein